MTPVVKSAKSVPSLPKVAKKETKKPEADKPKNDGNVFGLTLGKRVNATIRHIMENNFKNKWTDDQIREFMGKEFPNRVTKNILFNVREMRWRYNFGKLHEDKDGNPHAPAEKAVRYNADGTVYTANVGKPKMTDEEKAMKAEERKEKEVERRAAEIESLAKAEANLVALRERITTRQIEWDAKHGPLVPKEKLATPKKKVVVKKATK